MPRMGRSAMATPMSSDAQGLLLLLAWMSPAFPIGSFAYSHGLEQAIAARHIARADDLREWLADLVARGSGWNDAVLFARCRQDEPHTLNTMALALAASHERWLETTQLGRAFSKAAAVFLPSHASGAGGHGVGPMAVMPGEAGEIAYPIAAGSACAAMGIAKREALLAFLQGFASVQISVAVRLVPLGQTAGLLVLRDLMPVIAETAARAETATLDDLGSITLLADIAAMRHETLEPRIFRT